MLAARAELAQLESEQPSSSSARLRTTALPWWQSEEYVFDANRQEDTRRLFDGRCSCSLQRHVWPPITGSAPVRAARTCDELDGAALHLSHRDVTLLCISRAPIDRLVAYRKRMAAVPLRLELRERFRLGLRPCHHAEQAQGQRRSRRWSTTRRLAARVG